MLKIFLAEDEFVVREGIKNNVDWAGHGYEFCGEAPDGEVALQMIRELKPDILITDIKMPFMDGIELSKNVKAEFPWIEIIILSGYSDFEYAKQAISLGVAHYLNKPISGADLVKEIDEIAGKIEKDFGIKNISEGVIDRSRIETFLKTGSIEEVSDFTEDLFHDIGIEALKSNLFRQYLAIDLYFSVTSFLNDCKLDKQQIDGMTVSQENYSGVKPIMDYTLAIITKAIELRDTFAGNRYTDIIEEVKRYIEKYYSDENLSLNVLAEHVNFSPNHLSMIFSQQVGCSFIKYLTDYRMTKAKEILMCSSKRSVDISAEVGYKDPHYFSYLFKKTQGMTPTQYRSSRNTDENKKTVSD